MRVLPFALLKPLEPRDIPTVDSSWIVSSDYVLGGALDEEIEQWHTTSCLCIDLETRGTDTWKPETGIVGIAVGWLHKGERRVRYIVIDPDRPEPGVLRILFDAMDACAAQGGHVIAHNVMFDQAILLEMYRRSHGVERWPTFTHCTYIMYKMLASEGWPGQQWGLKAAMVDVLGWPGANDDGIDEWLIAHGYHSQGPRRAEGETPDAHLEACASWVAEKPETRKIRPDKAEMWRVPADILGTYACLDVLGTMSLYLDVLRPVLDQFPELEDYHCGPYLNLVRLLISQQRWGIRIDRDLLEARGVTLRQQMAEAERRLRDHPRASQIIREYEEELLAPLLAKPPERYLKKKYRPEPEKLTKKGEVSKNWLKWSEQAAAPLVESKNWLKWDQKVAKAVAGELADYKFALSSGNDIRILLYECFLVDWEDGEPFQDKKKPGSIFIKGRYGRVEIDRTDSGGLPVDSEALNQLDDDELRDTLQMFSDSHKELSFVESYLEMVAWDEYTQTWRLHPGWVAYGTKTGRLAGRDPNLQQAPKSIDLLDCIIPDDGCVWLESDAAALEPHVLAELSRDPALLALYGPDANPNHDRYLFSAAGYPGDIGDKVRRYYDRAAPTKESVAEAKKHCKLERTIAKLFVLAGDYGAGARKIWRSAQAQGVPLSLDQAKEIWQAQRDVHKGVFVDFAEALDRELDARGGWILTGLGFPNPVWADRRRDAINRCLAADTQIITSSGVKPIVAVLPDDLVWNGSAWCSHGGVVCNGIQSAVQVEGVTMTPDHLILEEDGTWHAGERYTVQEGNDASQQKQPHRPSYSWSAVWKLGCAVIRVKVRKAKEVGVRWLSS